ncbi:MAG TPA: hypothetical protein VHM00_03415, partial [Caldimonas sp.]|nr:hypothetical protein [Caldimonas sp.]
MSALAPERSPATGKAAGARRILILGASYGSLLATKLVLARHAVEMVCLPAEAELFNRQGAIVRMPVKGRATPVEVRTAGAAGALSATAPADARPGEHDL